MLQVLGAGQKASHSHPCLYHSSENDAGIGSSLIFFRFTMLLKANLIAKLFSNEWDRVDNETLALKDPLL